MWPDVGTKLEQRSWAETTVWTIGSFVCVGVLFATSGFDLYGLIRCGGQGVLLLVNTLVCLGLHV